MRNTDSLLDDLLGKAPPKAITLDINKLHPFEGHPYKALDNEDMEALADNILTQGVLTPLCVRQTEDAIVKMCEAQFRRRTDRDTR